MSVHFVDLLEGRDNSLLDRAKVGVAAVTGALVWMLEASPFARGAQPGVDGVEAAKKVLLKLNHNLTIGLIW